MRFSSVDSRWNRGQQRCLTWFDCVRSVCERSSSNNGKRTRYIVYAQGVIEGPIPTDVNNETTTTEPCRKSNYAPDSLSIGSLASPCAPDGDIYAAVGSPLTPRRVSPTFQGRFLTLRARRIGVFPSSNTRQQVIGQQTRTMCRDCACSAAI